MWWYNIGLYIFSAGVRAAALWNCKARLWIDGRRDIFDRLAEAVTPGSRIVWFHAASLGEFEQGRPLMEEVRRRHPEFKILLTFFSPSGYEIRKDYKGADWVFYLPLDTPLGAKRFLDTVNPEIAIFIKYEFWLNYLAELGRRHTRTYLVSAIFRSDSVFFRPYGGIFRRALGVFDRLFVQNHESKELLAQIGVSNAEIAGDTRFDRVMQVAGSGMDIECVAEFATGRMTLVAGSTWEPDEEILAALVERHPDMRFVVAPHEMDAERIERMRNVLGGEAVKYSDCAAGTPVPDSSRVMIVDAFGLLSRLYRYGQLAYVGGGFGAGIHNILEAAAYGVPVAFGPNNGRFREARDLIALGAAAEVVNADELDGWLTRLKNDPLSLERLGLSVRGYMEANRGATDKIMKELFP